MESGSINTGIGQWRTKYVPDGSSYADECARVVAILDRREAEGVSAEQIAQTVLTAIEAERPRALYARGSRASLTNASRLQNPMIRLVSHGLATTR